ncbi:hypothetical protein L2E82_40836 [Cichorium intybus]|uniref:Uncharacterized protein n=1 Tax=Cichorium intybus TaxID=13427 RepID=A0ACB9ANT0_CICIN|nr:hypothetical protein L2E82_40836 [Cichorium intybus]
MTKIPFIGFCSVVQCTIRLLKYEIYAIILTLASFTRNRFFSFQQTKGCLMISIFHIPAQILQILRILRTTRPPGLCFSTSGRHRLLVIIDIGSNEADLGFFERQAIQCLVQCSFKLLVYSSSAFWVLLTIKVGLPWPRQRTGFEGLFHLFVGPNQFHHRNQEAAMGSKVLRPASQGTGPGFYSQAFSS